MGQKLTQLLINESKKTVSSQNDDLTHTNNSIHTGSLNPDPGDPAARLRGGEGRAERRDPPLPPFCLKKKTEMSWAKKVQKSDTAFFSGDFEREEKIGYAVHARMRTFSQVDLGGEATFEKELSYSSSYF